MFFTNKKNLTNALNKLQKDNCCYFGNSCDCKYLGDSKEFIGEQTGCPELRSAALIIEAMTEEEYEHFCKLARMRLFK